MLAAMVIRAVFIATLAMMAATAGTEASQPTTRRQLTVAAASDLQAALPDLVRRFEREARATVRVSFGSSGNFFAQIQNGAPFDVYFSADIDYPKKLVASGDADPSSLYQYATGRIVLWARKNAGIDVSRGLKGLLDSRVTRIAIANPRFAPYGRAAEAALRHEQIYDAVRSKLVLGDSISQTAQLVDSGNAEVGIIALSLALGPALRASGTYTEIPATSHPPIDQAVVIVSASKNRALAREFLAFVRRPEIAQHLHGFGFTMPPSPAR
jgi:molybdate transport system substrate-binding protein